MSPQNIYFKCVGITEKERILLGFTSDPISATEYYLENGWKCSQIEFSPQIELSKK